MIHDLEIILHLVRSPVQNIDAVGVPVLSRAKTSPTRGFVLKTAAWRMYFKPDQP